jgi:hypothetical protein
MDGLLVFFAGVEPDVPSGFLDRTILPTMFDKAPLSRHDDQPGGVQGARRVTVMAPG